ncbi:MAG: ribose 5-phosphate isomerase B [Xanthomonadaceae bacterium]|nr:ribose 5-phosphate isomerase B [Xanthomonadaceae bacterium]
MLKIWIASDHAGFELKEQIKRVLKDYEWVDLGPPSAERVDYPDYAEKCSRQVAKTPGALGVLICGSGVGMSIAANKIPGIRAALVSEVAVAKLSKEHNDANILCLGQRFLEPKTAIEITRTFIETPFSKDERHEARVKKMMKLEK